MEFGLDELDAAIARLRLELLETRNERCYWRGELATSALSTATASLALTIASHEMASHSDPLLGSLVRRGPEWLATHANADGGWGDTTRSASNLSTTLLS